MKLAKKIFGIIALILALLIIAGAFMQMFGKGKVKPSNWFGKSDIEQSQPIDGVDGQDGKDGETPYIGENGNWFVGETDTGVKAQGQDGLNGADGQDGETPYIGENGNWFVGETDTGVKAQGEQGPQGVQGPKGDTQKYSRIVLYQSNGNLLTAHLKFEINLPLFSGVSALGNVSSFSTYIKNYVAVGASSLSLTLRVSQYAEIDSKQTRFISDGCLFQFSDSTLGFCGMCTITDNSVIKNRYYFVDIGASNVYVVDSLNPNKEYIKNNAISTLTMSNYCGLASYVVV